MARRDQERSRREFLIEIGVAAGTASGILACRDAAAARSQPEYGFLIDTTRCKYCKKCIDACEEKHRDGTPGTHYTDVKLAYPRDADGDAVAVPLHCMHCIDPPCVPVCQGGALEKSALGPVTLNDDKCIGCLSCLSVCPFENCLHYQSYPVKFYKCDLCYDRIAGGLAPACVDACKRVYYDALSFGPFGDILPQARQRAEKIGGVLLYPERTHSLILFEEEKFNEALMAELFGFSRSFSIQADAKAALSEIAHLGWLPIIGGAALYLRKKRMERSPDGEDLEG
jgi:Fe-S-cluster-containing dehydrogenase component